jgi:EspG family
MPEIVSLSLSTVDLLWEHLALGRIPPPLDIRSVGATDLDRTRLRTAMWRDLTARRLADAGQRLKPGITDLMAVIAHHDHAITSLSIMDDGRLVRTLAAADQNQAVLAVQGPRNLHIAPIDPSELPANIVGVLPATRPFPGRPVTVRDGDPAVPMLARPRRRAGYFTAHRRGEVSSELAWVDTDRGRFSSRFVLDPTGSRCTAHTPVGRDDLVAQLTDLLTGRADEN